MQLMSAFYVKIDVIQRTWYAFSYEFRVDLHIEWYKAVDRTILFEIRANFFKYWFKIWWILGINNQKALFFTIYNKNKVLLTKVDLWFTLTQAGE